jgi:hypothetical protein
MDMRRNMRVCALAWQIASLKREKHAALAGYDDAITVAKAHCEPFYSQVRGAVTNKPTRVQGC